MANLPNSIAASVGQVGGAPATQAQVSGYLTQLAGSLNGFTGPVSNAINYLLDQSTQPPPSATWAPVANINLVLGQNIAWGIGAAGAVLTPAHTGRVVCIAAGNWNPNSTAATTWTETSQIYCGLGVAPALGSSGVPTGATAIGAPALMGFASGVTNQTLWGCVMCIGFALGLAMDQLYWFDMFTNSGGASAGIIQFGQMLVIEV